MYLTFQDHLLFTSTLTLQPLLQLKCVVGRCMRIHGPERHEFDSSQISKGGLGMLMLLVWLFVLNKHMGKPGGLQK